MNFKGNSENEGLIYESHRQVMKHEEETKSLQPPAEPEKKAQLVAKPKGVLKYYSYKTPPDLALAEVHMVFDLYKESHFSGKARNLR